MEQNDAELVAELRSRGIRVERWIGAGAHGRIAACTFEDTRWAVKVGPVALIEREWQVGRAVQHPFVLSPRRAWWLRDSGVLLMEHFEGQPLVDAIRRELPPVPARVTRQNLPMAFGYELNDLGENRYRFCGLAAAERLARWVGKLAEAIEAIHRADLVHLDIAPENLLVRDDDVRVADLGLARRVGEQPELPVGSAAYLAPELGHGRVSAACDWYSLGVVLFQALTGGLPFEGGGPEVLVRKQSLSAPSVAELCPDASHRLVELVAGLLRRDVATRFGLKEVRALCAP